MLSSSTENRALGARGFGRLPLLKRVHAVAEGAIDRARPLSARVAVRLLLNLVALQLNHRPKLRRYLSGRDGWINFTVGFRTEDGVFQASIRFRDGRVSVAHTVPRDVDTTLVFASEEAAWDMLRGTPNESLNLLMRNRLRSVGNFSYLTLFNFYLSLIMGGLHERMERRRQADEKADLQSAHHSANRRRRAEPARLSADRADPGVKFLDEPYLSAWSIGDFPRLERFLDAHFSTKPEVCPERPVLLTRWFREHGLFTQKDGRPWTPELRQGHALKHLLTQREPIIRTDDLLAGTTTSKDVGVLLFPDGIGTLLWGELRSIPKRELNPYDISQDTIDLLHREVFPFWAEKNFREIVRQRHGSPRCQELDERFAVYFVWKTVGVSHTIPDFPTVLSRGTEGVRDDIQTRIDSETDPQARDALSAMVLALEGLESYAENLSRHAARQAANESEPRRKAELQRLANICARAPREPASSLDEAVNAVWITWVGLHAENTNTGLSLGRLDQWLQPYFEADMERLASEEERKAYIRYAVELVGCLFLRCTDHLPLVPDLGNYLFGGASSDQAITLGGVTPDGEDAVNDMTYVFLKVTEMLAVRDPNVNARFHPGKNSDTYLRRLCEVNLITSATPSMHNDEAVLKALQPFAYDSAAANDWSATGCVEPTLSGRHMGHTGSILLSMVAALEMALNGGRHPLMRWSVGPATVGEGELETFEDVFHAFESQLQFLIDEATTYNHMLGEVHAELRPAPLLSSMMDGCVRSGRDVTNGGAQYNTSGVALIGLADVTDSLLAVRQLVFRERRVSLEELVEAVRDNFEGHSKLLAAIRNKVGFFGSGDAEAVAMANRVARVARDMLAEKRNFRGGSYTAGFWSMSNHVAFGTLAGALPSGRLAGKAFTPGLTPQPVASTNLLDNLRDVAQLDPTSLSNNMAFNVRVVPSASDTHEKVVDYMTAYAKSYFELGGMQMQLNVVNTETLRDAMANPDAYRDLLVRISGYNAYFVTLNRDMQRELIERAEYGI